MTNQRPDVDRVLSAWLVEGVDAAPPAVVRAALDQAAATRQRRELGFIRRVYNVEATATLNRNNWLRLGLLGMAGVLAVVAAVGAARLFAPEPIPVTPARATALVLELSAPPRSRPAGMVEGSDAVAAMRARMRVAVFSDALLQELGGEAAAALFDPDGSGDQRAYTATVLTFDDPAAAAAAIESISTDLRFATGQWATGNSPFTDEHLPARRSEGFERSGTYWAFGGTSAGESSRVGHLNIWRTDDVVFVVFGVDWATPGSSAYQSAIEAGVVALSESLASLLP
ncbi:MAG: hypothetical protein QOJ81_869 [Chloroflexota bacterium]|jgi:hypothetical protein|nr:hypothetical protein [Chloroflexota bacterium]